VVTDTVPAPREAPALMVTVVVMVLAVMVRAPVAMPGLLKVTVAPWTKLVPVSVIVKEPPAGPEEGLIPVRVGAWPNNSPEDPNSRPATRGQDRKA
jgi:hypothetical protein